MANIYFSTMIINFLLLCTLVSDGYSASDVGNDIADVTGPLSAVGRMRRSSEPDLCDPEEMAKYIQRLRKENKKLKKGIEKKTKSLKSLINRLERRISSIEQQTTSRAHFEASPDPRLLSQVRRAEDIETIEGTYTANGLLPSDTIYRFWDVSPETDSRSFLYEADTGKVMIQQSGTYIIYTQVMFHDDADRCGYSIFIDATDVARCVAFGDSNRGGGSHRTRHSHSTPPPGVVTHLNYRQCSTQTIRYVHRGSGVYLRGLYNNRTLVATPTLTFWQIAKLD